jgi:conflict system STAND superfamily ATPase
MIFKPPAAFVTHLVDNGFPRHRKVEDRKDFSVHYLDLSVLRILAGPFTPFVVLNTLPARQTLSAEDLDVAVDGLLNVRATLLGEFVVLLVGSVVEPLPARLRTRLHNHGVAILDCCDFLEIESLAEQPEERDRRVAAALVRSLGRAALSPYRHGQPAFGERFFGRTEAIKEALHSRGVATLVGCRRIGKTSMLREISRRLRSEFGDRLRTADIYGNPDQYRNPNNVLGTIIEQLFIGQPDVERLATDPDLERKFDGLVRMLPDRALRDGSKLEIAVFIDEFDELLELDSRQGFALLRTLRGAFQGRPHCRLFLAGFRRVMRELSDARSELHNFGTSIELEGLSRRDATTMIQKPLRMLGVDVGPEHVALIYDETKGRPELIQLFCGELVAAVEETGELLSSEQLMARVISSSQFRAKISSTFFSNATPLEQLLSYLLVARWETRGVPINEFEFGFADADDLLMQCHVELDVMALDQLLGNLRLLSVIESVGASRYRLAVPAFANYLLAQDVRFLIRKALRKAGASSARGWPAAFN